VRAVRGAQGDRFASALFGGPFLLSPQSDRMGLRFSGAKMEGGPAGDMISSPVVPGTLQVPPDGQPIVLMADAQTIGGYPQAAHVATADIPILAQLKPGDSVRFREVTLEEAQALLLAPSRHAHD
jgi:antagonist of KipI